MLATGILVSLGNVSSAQKPSDLLERENKLTQTSSNSKTLSIVTEGFEALCFGSSKNAYTIWANHNNPVISTVITQRANDIDKMLNFMLGKCIKYSVIATVPLTQETQVVYVKSGHKKGAFLWKILVYKGTDGWLISSVKSNTDPSDIVPNSLLIKGKQ